MTLLPENARSEFVMPANGESEATWPIIRRFQIAEPASCRPALSPTRGSGDGAVTSGLAIAGVCATPIAGAANSAAVATARRDVFPASLMDVSWLGAGGHLTSVASD